MFKKLVFAAAVSAGVASYADASPPLDNYQEAHCMDVRLYAQGMMAAVQQRINLFHESPSVALEKGGVWTNYIWDSSVGDWRLSPISKDEAQDIFNYVADDIGDQNYLAFGVTIGNLCEQSKGPWAQINPTIGPEQP